MPGKGKRVVSNPWGRLRALGEDPLQSMGLPSKGDKRLLNFKNQEKYYTKIMERYLSFCTDAGKSGDLAQRFESLEITDVGAPSFTFATSSSSKEPSDEALQCPENTKAIMDVMMALRKLREGIVASKRADHFSVQAYIFSIRLAVLIKQPESYHPAILHLLRYMAFYHPLTPTEIQEIAGYLILDTACRRRELAEAYNLRYKYEIKGDVTLDLALHAVAHDNYIMFQRLKSEVDRHRFKLLEWADEEMRLVTLKCFGRSYLHVDLAFLETAADREWKDLKELDGVGWELEDDNRVIIRKVKAR